MGTISFKQGRGNRIHNLRRYPEGKIPQNIHTDMTPDNVIWHDETLNHAYHRIFEEAVEEYNSRQKRNDRKIKDYQTKIKNSRNGEKLFYEDVIQWGDKEIFQNHPELKTIAKDCLLEYLDGFRERNPNLEIIGAYIHMDEASPHLHLDYIPVATGYKSGMKKRNAIDKAMKNLGFGTKLRDSKDNATKQWKEAEREVLKTICVRHNLVVDAEVRTPEREDLSVLDYKKEMRLKENRELEKRKEELEKITKELEGNVLTTAEIDNLDFRKPLLSQNTKVQYKMLCDLRATARKIDEIQYECFIREQNVDEKMREAKDLEENAKKIINNEVSIYNKAKQAGDDYVKECKVKVAKEVEIEKKSILDKLNETIASLKAKIIELKDEIKALFNRKSELQDEIEDLEQDVANKKREVAIIIEKAELKSEEIIKQQVSERGNLKEYMEMIDYLGIVLKSDYYKVKEELDDAYEDAYKYMNSKEKTLYGDRYSLKGRLFEELSDDIVKRTGELTDAAKAFMILGVKADEYAKVKDKPQSFREYVESIGKSREGSKKR